REGARQLAFVGAPNSGKSQLLKTLTNATPEVAEYPYTTRIPIPGMLVFENVRLQLIDLPPISAEYTESWVPQIIRNADAVLWIIDLADDDILDKVAETKTFLANAHTNVDEMKVLIVGNKSDAPAANDRLEILKETYPGRFPITTMSAA